MLSRLENWLHSLGAIAVIALGALIAGNVLLRAVFDYSIPDSVVIAKELMIAVVILPLSAVTVARANVVVEFLANHLPVSVQRWLIVFGWLVGLLVMVVLLFSGWRELVSTWQSGGFFFGDLSLPKWPGRLLFVLGVAVCVVRLVQMLFSDGVSAWHGKPADKLVNRPESQ
ncbi:MAG: TRAP transporter small permease [Granulosicoccus sp.]